MFETKSFTLWLLQFMVLLVLLIFFLWLSLRPKQPAFAIVDFSVPTPDDGNRTSPVSQGGENGTVTFELEIQNPNQDSGIYYDDMLLTFYSGQDTLGQKTILSFYQKKGRTDQVFECVNADARVWRKLVSAISNATAELKVEVVTKIRHRMWGRTSKHQGINLQGKLPIGSNGKISGKKKKKIRLHHNTKKWRK